MWHKTEVIKIIHRQPREKMSAMKNKRCSLPFAESYGSFSHEIEKLVRIKLYLQLSTHLEMEWSWQDPVSPVQGHVCARRASPVPVLHCNHTSPLLVIYTHPLQHTILTILQVTNTQLNNMSSSGTMIPKINVSIRKKKIEWSVYAKLVHTYFPDAFTKNLHTLSFMPIYCLCRNITW